METFVVILHRANVFIGEDNTNGTKGVPLTTLAAMKIGFRNARYTT